MILTKKQYEETILVGGKTTQDYGKQEFRQCPVCRSYVWTGTVVKPGGEWELKHMCCYICAEQRERKIRSDIVSRNYKCKVTYKEECDCYNESGYRTITVEGKGNTKFFRFAEVLEFLWYAGYSLQAYYRGPGEMFADLPYGFRYGKGKKWVVKQRWGRDV